MNILVNQASIISSVKDTTLIQKRRNQIIKASVALFKQKGYHRSTTREIAKAAGFSIGTLYEYVRTKEDVLYLVFESINDSVYTHLKKAINKEAPSRERLKKIIESYFRLMNDMQEEVIILYQEVKSLQEEQKNEVLKKEKEMVLLLKEALILSMPNTFFNKEAELIANNLFVQGHMWCFRRWMLHQNFTLDEYIKMQTRFLEQAIPEEQIT